MSMEVWWVTGQNRRGLDTEAELIEGEIPNLAT